MAQHPDETSILIDDKPLHVGDLPRHCTGVLLDRTYPKRVVKKDRYYVINNLEAVEELLP